ncbi:MAG: galactose-1-phosphate uridylyltransferase, partial [Clostridia bacterium]|nr:galactose-1-phosphate uridylyltransferase [Clostridia bacterium]
MINTYIKQLCDYAVDCELIKEDDRIYCQNRIIEILNLDSFNEPKICPKATLEEILKNILDYAVQKGLLEDSVVYRDLFDTKLMSVFLPLPSQVREKFWAFYKESPEKATSWYYKLSCDSDYIRRYRVCKDLRWTTDTDYGTFDITVNLSKPEKDPKAVAAAKLLPQSGYPKCMLCVE